MQKLVKRANQAQRQANRKAADMARQEENVRAVRVRDSMTRASKEIRTNLKEAQKARREAWELGPLAPKRDLDFNGYGMVKEMARMDWSANGMARTKIKLVEERCAWAGGIRTLNLAPKDRVVLLEGPDKGKIDRIATIDIANGSVTLESLHKSLTSNIINNQAFTQAMPISIGSIRLVHPIKDPKTGATRDVIINELKATHADMQSANMSFDRWTYGKKWDRLVPGLNVVIPWPEVEAPTFETHEGDTVRDLAEERTFHYSLLSAPMPESVLDELRNKYSKHRTRHEAWYVAKVEAEANAKQMRHEAIKSMQTPLEEFHEKQRELRAAKGEPELSDAMLEKIGAIIAQKKGAALGEAGVSEVSSTSDASPTSSSPQ